jgi:hypothetical protein
MRLAILVLVVAKNTRELLSIASELAFLAGFAMAGAKSPDYSRSIMTRLKSCPVTAQEYTTKEAFFLKHLRLRLKNVEKLHVCGSP